MIDLATAYYVHNTLIDDFGCSNGVSDLGSLEAALYRPYATFDQQDLYPTPIEKAAAIFESIIINHPFIDGNKRTAYALMRLILFKNNIDLIASQDEKYQMTISASKAETGFEQIRQWLADE